MTRPRLRTRRLRNRSKRGKNRRTIRRKRVTKGGWGGNSSAPAFTPERNVHKKPLGFFGVGGWGPTVSVL